MQHLSSKMHFRPVTGNSFRIGQKRIGLREYFQAKLLKLAKIRKEARSKSRSEAKILNIRFFDKELSFALNPWEKNDQ